VDRRVYDRGRGGAGDGALPARDRRGASAALVMTTERRPAYQIGPRVRDKRTSRLARMDVRRDDCRKANGNSLPGSGEGDNPYGSPVLVTGRLLGQLSREHG
jgi:hypothetical protein